MRQTKSKPASRRAPVAVAAHHARPARWPWAVGLLVALVALLEAYGPASRGAFVFDDQYLPFLSPQAGQMPFRAWLGVRPVVMASYWLNYKASGLATAPYHLVSLLLHFGTSVLVTLILLQLLGRVNVEIRRRTLLAAFGGGLFLLHPLQTEAVAYVSSRSETVSVFFYYAAYCAFLYRRREPISWPRTLTVLLLFGLACLSKEHAVTLPALLLLTDVLLSRDSPWAAIRANSRLYGLIAVGALAAGALVLRVLSTTTSAGFGLRGLSPVQYLATQCQVIWHYVRLFVFPVGLNADYDYPVASGFTNPASLFGLLALVAAAALAWFYRRRAPLAALGVLTFLALLAPTSSIVPIADVIAERRTYLPFLGLVLIACEALRRVRLAVPPLAAALAAVLVLCAVLTHGRARVWAGPLPLWRDVIEKSPNKPRARFQLAHAHYTAGQCADASLEYATAARLGKPDYRLLIDWGLALECANRPLEAIQKLQQAAKLERTAHVYSQLGMVLGKHNQPGPALAALDTALQIDPGFAVAHVYRGHVFLSQGARPQATEAYRQALNHDPTNEMALRSLAGLQAQAGR